MQTITLIINTATVVILLGIIYASRLTIKHARATTKLLEQYRHDIDWLAARVDLLEAQQRGVGK